MLVVLSKLVQNAAWLLIEINPDKIHENVKHNENCNTDMLSNGKAKSCDLLPFSYGSLGHHCNYGPSRLYEPPHDKTNKMACAPSKDSDQPGHSLSTWRKLGSLATHWAQSEDSDQTGWIPRLIWVFAGRTVILLVLLWGSSFSLILKWANQIGGTKVEVRRGKPGGHFCRWWDYISQWLLWRSSLIRGSTLFAIPSASFRHSHYCMQNHTDKWATSWENLSLGFETSWDSNQPAQLMRLASRGIILSRQWRTKALIRLHECASWSAASFFKYGKSRFSHDLAQMQQLYLVSEFLDFYVTLTGTTWCWLVLTNLLESHYFDRGTSNVRRWSDLTHTPSPEGRTVIILNRMFYIFIVVDIA